MTRRSYSTKERIEAFIGFANGDPAFDPDPVFDPFEDTLTPPRKPRRRKPNMRALVEQAKAAGATTVTLPDGTRLDLSANDDANAEMADANPWLLDSDGRVRS